ncbi:DUF2188 domain-containing protein [Carnobacterium iners]|uniref:DUF2188 domain-containing protein n=1 Tax=Carnobacterium iners TaxID=1073423 RepID=UPI0008D899E4|nr:DUF2188 domain-containing protein [Carnobacterium iners]SEK66910.1 hypothetical protein SAMN04488114_10879 [Carnobacterium iners]
MKQEDSFSKHDISDRHIYLFDNNLIVFYHDDRRTVKTKGTKQINEPLDEKIKAVSRAKEIVANEKTTILIYKKDGTIEK